MASRRTANVFDVLNRFQIDFLLKAAFSAESPVCASDETIEPYSFHRRLRHWNRWQALVRFEHLIYKSVLSNKFWEFFCTPSRPAWTVLTNNYLEGRVSQKTSSQGKQDLLDKWLAAQEKHSDNVDLATVRRLVASTINAGFDTTAFTMGTLLVEILTHPDAMNSLLQELHQARDEGLLSDIPQWTEVNKLPYLDAVIKEAMRMHSLLNLPLERVVPDGGADVLGYYLPAGTIVGCSAEVVGQDKDCYGIDADQFKPGRWLTDDSAKRISMERGSLGFGSGKRGCIGKHIALLEMKKTMPALLLNFEVRTEKIFLSCG